MKQRLFPLMAAVSLLLCAATIAGWVRSHWVGDVVHFAWRTSSNGLITEMRLGVTHGGGDFGFFRVVVTPETKARRWSYFRAPPVPLRTLFFKPFAAPVGYGWYRDKTSPAPGTTGRTFIETGILLPYWLLTLLTAIAPASWWLLGLKRRRATRRIQHGLCPTCGYDLRATPEKSGPLFDRCPECGAVPASSALRDRAGT